MKAFLLAQVLLFIMECQNSTADPCLQNYGGCDKRNGLCWGTSATTHYCTCKPGYKHDTRFPGHRCVDVNECREESVCDQNSFCQNTIGSYVCHCKCGYVMDYTGQKCLDAKLIKGRCQLPTRCYHPFLWWILPVDFKTSNAQYGYITDVNSMKYHDEKASQQRDTCSCESGFRYDSCGYCVDIDECAEHYHECTGSGSKCVNTEGSYYCECKAGHTLEPNRRRCYAPRQNSPQKYMHPDLSSLSSAGINKSIANSIIKPFSILDYPSCTKNTTVGTTKIVSFDLNGNGINDITLTWFCTTGRKSVLTKFKENEAKWGPWSCWTACKATCWGGLQTRSRTCLNGIPGLKRCPGKGSDSRTCYSGEKCPYRVRKDAKTLSRTEMEDFIQAMKKYKRDTTSRGFHSAGSVHGWPNQCDRKACCPHDAKFTFLSWHRTITLNFEEGLTRFLKDKTLGLPYWNWLATDPNPPGLVWNKTVFGSENPFANMTARIDLTGPMRTIQRAKRVYMPSIDLSHDTWRDVTINLAETHNMLQFAVSLERVHDGPHDSACGDGSVSDRCIISFVPIPFAAFDPLFLFHHTQVDRLWALEQQKVAEAGTTTWTTQTALDAMEDKSEFGRRHMPFGNTSLNAFPIVQAVNTMRDSYYYKELTGVMYDYLGNDGFPPDEEGAINASRDGETGAIFVAHYLKELHGNLTVYINYFIDFKNEPCSQLQEHRRVGRTIIMPTDREYNNSIPTLIAMKKVGDRSLGTDFPVKACYTNRADCLIGCPSANNENLDTFPTPAIVHDLPNEPVDIYKFNWEPGNRMPEWQISLRASTKWLYFYGSRAKNVYQVATAEEWEACSSERGERMQCSFQGEGSTCLLPVGIYYLVDQDPDHCRQGLRMIVTSTL